MIKMKELLREFAEYANSGAYNKVPYDVWRKLKKYENESVDVYIPCSERGCEITLTAIESQYDFWFYENDYSFGSFLYDQVQDGWFDSVVMAKAPVCSIGDNKNKSIITWDTLGDITVREDNASISSILDQVTLKMNLKENNDMDNKLFKNFDFGPCTANNIKMSLYGLAVKNASDTWVSYDSKTDSVIDVDILNFDGGRYFYKIPVAIKDVKPGDVVIHNRKPVFVKAVEDNRVIAVDPAAGEEKAVLLTKSPFGFDFVTKVVSFLDNICGNATADTPFGNILPLILLSGDNRGSNDLLPLLFLSGKTDFTSNPLALYALMGSNRPNDILPFLFLADGTAPAFGSIQAPAAK